MKSLLAIIAVSYPIIFVRYFVKKYSVNIEKIFTADEINVFRKKRAEKGAVKYKERLASLLWSDIFAIVFGVSQSLLFKLTEFFENEFVILDRIVYLWIYPFLPGLFIGLSVAANFLYYQSSQKGKFYLKEMLLSSDGGFTGYQEYRFSKAIVYIFTVLSFMGNMVAYNNFIGIKNDRLMFQEFMSNIAVSKSITDIEEIVFFTKREAPNGEILGNCHPTIFFKDGSSIHTLNLIYTKDIREFIDILQKESANNISVIRIDGYKKHFYRKKKGENRIGRQT